MSDCYWCDRRDKVKALIEVYDDALQRLGEGGVQSYTLDTGQTRVTKTKFDISSLRITRDSLLNDLAVLDARCLRNGSFTGRPLY